MKVYFDATQRGKDKYGAYYREIFDAIKECGYKHLFDSLVNQSPEEFYQKFENSTDDAQGDLYHLHMKQMQEADINIFEASLPSLSIGFLINKSLDLNKPTIVLYYEENKPVLISGISHDKLIVKKYDKKNIKTMVADALGEASGLRDKRFNFFISPQLLQYLERVSNSLGITKSTFIRNLITEHMRKHRPTSG